MGVEKDSNALSILNDFGDNTAVNGIPNIKRANSILRKLIWIVIFLGASGYMTKEVIAAITYYFTYPYNTVTTEVFVSNLYFPAVTICNLNPIRLSKVAYANDSHLEDLLRPSTPKRGSSKHDDAVTLQWTLMHQSDEVRHAMGHQLDTMLIGCTFNGMDCDSSDFSTFYNYAYGNCFTFNPGTNGRDIRIAGRAGATHGLSLELYIEENEYLPALTETAGVKVVVHRQHRTVFAAEEGIYAAPAQRTAVGIRRVDLNRLTDPYASSCWNITANQTHLYSAYAKDQENYTRAACYKTCLQTHVISECGCLTYKASAHQSQLYDDAYNGTGEASANNLGYCSLSDICLMRVANSFDAGDLDCDCHSECWEADIAMTVSHAMWPAPQYSLAMFNELASIYPAIADIILDNDQASGSDDETSSGNVTSSDSTTANATSGNVTSSSSAPGGSAPANATSGNVTNSGSAPANTSSANSTNSNNSTGGENTGTVSNATPSGQTPLKPGVENNFLKLDVYYDELNFKIISETQGYLGWNLFADIGGQIGFWIGLSIVSAVEAFELVLDLFIFACYKCFYRNNNKKVSKSTEALNPLSKNSRVHLMMTPDSIF